jgi:hypothetical protein
MRRRRAAALPAVLFATALTSALVVGGVYAARTSHARARLAKSATELQSPAERVLVELVADWDTAGHAAMLAGTEDVLPTRSQDGASVAVRVTRLDEHNYWFVAEATRPAPRGMRTRVGLLVRATEGRIQPVPGPAWTRLP